MITPTPNLVPPDPNGRARKIYPLCELGIAPENMRFGEAPDEDIPQLAETLAAAGVLQPLTVRPGRSKKEKPAMALDGRRRILGLELLRDAGRIAPDYPWKCSRRPIRPARPPPSFSPTPPCRSTSPT